MNLIYLNIGGELFLTSSDNFALYPNSLLGKMFSGENKKLLVNDEYINNKPVYFFDRNPKIFSYILDYYRNEITYKPENINKHIYWKELKYWGFDFEKPSNIKDELWLCIKETAEKVSKCLMEQMYPEFFISRYINRDDKFLLKEQTTIEDVENLYRDVILNIIGHKKRNAKKDIFSLISTSNDQNGDILENSPEENVEKYNWNNLDLKELKEEINRELEDIYFRNNVLFNKGYSNIFDKYLEFYLSTTHNLQLNINFLTTKEYYYTDSYIENDIIYFGINHCYIDNAEGARIKTYQVSPISFY